MMRAEYTIGPGDIVSMGYISHQQFREMYKREMGALVTRITEQYEHSVFLTWNKPATIRPWSRWTIPATRCQRVKGVK